MTKKGPSDRKNILGIIPARGGSKGVPRKNIRLLHGIPLIAYSISEAKKSRYLNRVVVSTEDAEIAEVAQKWGADIVLRPDDLAADDSPVLLALKQVVLHLSEKEGYDADIVVMLQPTTPFRRAPDIDNAVELLLKTNADSVISVCEAPHTCNPHWVRKIVDGRLRPYTDRDEDLHPMRQDLPKVYWRNGQIYAMKRSVLFDKDSLYGDDCRPYIMPRNFHINIDEELDLLLAGLIIEKGLIEIDKPEMVSR